MSKPKKEKSKVVKKVLSSSEKANRLLGPIEDKIMSGLEECKMKISDVKGRVDKPRKAYYNSEGQPYSLDDYQADLKQMRNQIQEQKEQQQRQEQIRRRRAQQFVQKMKKQKEQHRQQVQHRSETALNKRMFSQTALQEMRERLQQRVDQKRSQIQQRIIDMEQKSVRRKEEWQKRQQEYRNKKPTSHRSHSIAHLPRLSEDRADKDCPVPRKGSLQSHVLKKPERRIEVVIEEASKKQGLHLKFEQRQGQRLAKITASNRKLAAQLYQQMPGSLPRSDPFKIKMQGDRYLKESLLKVKKSREDNPEEPSLNQGQLGLQGQQAHIRENIGVEKLREKWKQALQRLKKGEVSQEQGLSILHSIEGRLDRVDVGGVRERLRLKMDALAEPSSNSLDLDTVPSQQVLPSSDYTLPAPVVIESGASEEVADQ